MRIVIAALAAMALAGCAYNDVRTEENSSRISQSSPVSSERTYRNLMGALQACYQSGMLVQGQYYPEAREGEITVATVADNVHAEFFRLKVAPAAGGATVAMLRRPKTDKFDGALKEWVGGRDGDCPAGSRYEKPYPSQNPYSISPSAR